MSLRAFLIALDQLGGTLIGGYPDETISAKCYRMTLRGSRGWERAMRFVNWLFRDPNHCRDAWVAENDRRQAPPGEG